MITRDELVNEAIGWLDTPFHHQQCKKGVGVDCGMLAFGIAANLGIVDKKLWRKIATYPPSWHYNESESRLIEMIEGFNCPEVKYEDLKSGDMVVFHYGKTISHLGIILYQKHGSWHIMHAVNGNVNKVVVTILNDDLKRKFKKGFRFPGVEK